MRGKTTTTTQDYYETTTTTHDHCDNKMSSLAYKRITKHKNFHFYHYTDSVLPYLLESSIC